MNREIEANFVYSFINSFYQNRILYELSHTKKRINAIMRFSLNVNELINDSMINYKLDKFDNKIFNSFFNVKSLYVISFKYIDGIMMNIEDLLEYINNENMPVIACTNDLALIKIEFENSKNNFFFLKKKLLG